MYKILVTTTLYGSYGASVHTVEISFSNKADAVAAVELINRSNDKTSILKRNAIELF